MSLPCRRPSCHIRGLSSQTGMTGFPSATLPEGGQLAEAGDKQDHLPQVDERLQACRAYVGFPRDYDVIAAMQFNLLTFLGLRDCHFLVDIGCGSLRAGRLFIAYLRPGHYYGIDPNSWLIDAGIEHELGRDIINAKRPVFSYDDNFNLETFDQSFDFILAQSVFSHASERMISRCLSQVKRVLAPAGIFLATFAQGEENYTGDAWFYQGLVRYRLDHMLMLIEQQGLKGVPIDWPHNYSQRWLAIVHPANEGSLPDLTDITDLFGLQNQVTLLRGRLARLEGHPYLQIGFAFNRLIHRLMPRIRIKR